MPRIIKSVEPAAVTDDPMYSTPEAAAYLRLKTSTLDNWRSTRRVAIPFYKVGGAILYRKSDLDAYLAGCRVEG